MSVTREYLGWDKPALPRAAKWLLERYGGDLGRVIAVTPGARAGRRLLELLVERAGGPLVPPRIVTLGALPELLYQPAAPVADELTSLLTRAYALRSADSSVLEPVVPKPPAADDLLGWLTLARELDDLHRDLAGEQVRVADVADVLSQKLVDFADESRWESLAILQSDYEQLLADRRRVDRHNARLDAVARKACRSDRHIALVGAVDLNRVTRAMLAQVAEQVTALIHAPADEAGGFDEVGCVNIDYWRQRDINLDPEQVDMVDRPRDQAVAALRAIAAQGDRSADQITVGLGDEAQGPMMQRTIELAGVPARRATGRAMPQVGPATLLDALARFIERNRADDFAALLRHPDLPVAADLAALDDYAARHLPVQLDERWLTRNADTESALSAMYNAVTAWLEPDPTERRALGAWAKPIAELLKRVYGDRDLSRYREDDAPIIQCLEQIGSALRDIAALDVDDPITPRVTLAEAMKLIVAQLSGRFVAPEGGKAAVEMLGWLELHLDDAPVMIITGMNEGCVPHVVRHHPFLPDQVRGALGLADSRRIEARDAAMLEAMRRSRPVLRLITGRRTAAGDPLAPSRLLLAYDTNQLPQWVSAFYNRGDAPAGPAPLLIEPGRDGFVIPVPHPPDKPIDRLSVTGFADYIACPYRFYLKHVLRLAIMNDDAVEMDALAFGTLAHDVLGAFGKSDQRDSDNDEAIAAFLADRLDDEVRRRYGKRPRTAVTIQAAMLKRRLATFARWQADQARAGWRIDPAGVESDMEMILDVDGKPFAVHGRIDRIDRHDRLGMRICDYKTGDSAKTPEQMHRTRDAQGDLQWAQLQLPLYHAMARDRGCEGYIELGYITLPKQPAGMKLAAATWDDDELAGALDLAKQIVRDIRAGRFFPPAEPPRYDDGFEGICMDNVAQRDQIIRDIRASMRREEAT